MRILALGGTAFVGRAFVESALLAGHEVTVLHRGKTPLPGGWVVDEILADRDGGLNALDGKSWDAVYDSCAYVPRIAREAAAKLVESCGRYLFISTISVFDPELNYQRPATPLETEVVNGETYGPLKVECEDVLTSILGDKLTIVRPGLVAGPNDHTYRFPYWVDRFASYGEVLVPDAPGLLLQQIDARDLGAFCVQLLADNRGGIFHAAGERSTFDAMLQTCAILGGGKPVPVPLDVIEANGVKPGSDLPLVWPTAGKLMEFGCEESLAAGLVRRPLRDTAADTLSWLLTLPEEKRSAARFAREKEEAVFSAVLG